MAVIGTPVARASTSTIDILSASTVSSRISTVEGIPSLARPQAVQVEQAQDADIEWVIRTDIGDAIDLTAANLPYDTASSSSSSSVSLDGSPYGAIRLRVTEALSIGVADQTIELVGSVIDPSVGLVGARLTSPIVARAGVYLLNWRIDGPDGRFLRSSQGYLIVNRGQYGRDDESRTGPPTVADIRLFLRDNGVEDNFLLATLEWDLAEIAATIVRCIRYWNESRPPIRQARFDTRSFPLPDLLLLGIHARMHMIVAAVYRREDVAYQAAGVEFADKRKADQYERQGQQMWVEFQREVKLRKTAVNIMGGFRHIQSNYPFGGRW